MAPDEIAEKILEVDCPCLYGEYQPADSYGHKALKQAVAIEHKAVTPPGDPSGIRVCCCFNDGEKDKEDSSFQSGWNGFLRLYNFYQFLPYSYFMTTDGLEHKVYDGLKFYDCAHN